MNDFHVTHKLVNKLVAFAMAEASDDGRDVNDLDEFWVTVAARLAVLDSNLFDTVIDLDDFDIELDFDALADIDDETLLAAMVVHFC